MIISKNVGFEGQEFFYFMENSYSIFDTLHFISAAFCGDRDIKMGNILHYFDKKIFCALIAFFMPNIVG